MSDRDWHRVLAASVPSTVMFCADLSLRYVMCDGAATLRRMGLTREAVIGRHVRDISQNPDEVETRSRQALEGVVTTTRLKRDGIDYQVIFAPAREGVDADGAIVGVVIISRDISEVIAEEQRSAAIVESALRELSLTDELTGLKNRRGFLELGEVVIKQALRSKRSALLFFCDLNGMKAINDTWGHDAGDEALLATARVLRATFRESDVIARLGGDEYVVLAADCVAEMGGWFRERAWQKVQDFNRTAGHPWKLSISVGAVPFIPHAPVTLARLIEQGDVAQYAAKRRRRETGRSDCSMLAVPQPKRAAE